MGFNQGVCHGVIVSHGAGVTTGVTRHIDGHVGRVDDALSILSLIPVIPGLLDALASGVGEMAEGDTSPFEVISTVVSIVVAIWSIILGIILIRENYRLSTGVAVVSVIASLFAAIVIVSGAIFFILVIIVLFGLAVATG